MLLLSNYHLYIEIFNVNFLYSINERVYLEGKKIIINASKNFEIVLPLSLYIRHFCQNHEN